MSELVIERPTAITVKQHRGQTSYHAGLAAEETAARHYWRAGKTILQQRYRGRAGEIDLVVRDADELVFVEVKKSKTHAQAAQRLSRRQMDRICRAALKYVGSEPMGLLSPMRFDVALVDQYGTIDVIENAFGGY
jgi:putative endonuclease